MGLSSELIVHIGRIWVPHAKNITVRPKRSTLTIFPNIIYSITFNNDISKFRKNLVFIGIRIFVIGLLFSNITLNIQTHLTNLTSL